MILISYLSDLLPGEAACIDSLAISPLRTRLYDLGMVAGTRVECVARAPFGGPSAYLIRGAVIALRHEDALTVGVQRMPAASRVRGVPLRA
ncbi:MAG: ferrous iron transport protein A [Clostridia bacterium]|nr:ferrous iron transport protein A [Clostridia bacterium]